MMILLGFGWLIIASLFVIYGWFRSGWEQRVPATIFNAGLVMAIGMDLTAAGFALMLGPRIVQVLLQTSTLAIDNPVYWIGLSMVMIGKSCFVWIAALGADRDWSRGLVFTYAASLIAWVVFTMWWYW